MTAPERTPDPAVAAYRAAVAARAVPRATAAPYCDAPAVVHMDGYGQPRLDTRRAPVVTERGTCGGFRIAPRRAE